MSKSSRFWWLHGAILLSAVVGCKSSNCGCGTDGHGGGVPPAGTPGLTGSAGATMYQQSAGGSGYAGMPATSSGMSASMPSSASQGMSSGMPAGQPYAPPASSLYSGPGLSSGAGGSH